MVLHIIPARYPEGGDRPPKLCLLPDPQIRPVVTPFKDSSSPSRELLFSLPCAAARAPVKPCLEFSSGLLAISRVQGPWGGMATSNII